MVHTYVFKDGATGADFNRLCRRIDRIAPGYKREEEQCFDEGVRGIRWVQGERVILAEIEPAYKAVTVYSDVPLPKLGELLERWKKRGGIRKIFSRFAVLARSAWFARAVKYVLLPLLITAAAAAVSVSASVGFALMMFFIFIETAAWVLSGSILFGWWLLIPGGAAVVTMADRKMERAVWWTAAALPAVSAVYACTLYRDIMPAFMGGLPWRYPLAVLLNLYMAAFPYLIIGDMAKSRLKKAGAETGGMGNLLPGFAMAALAVSVMICFSGAADNYLKSREAIGELAVGEAQMQLDNARAELTVKKYGSDMEAVAAYAVEKNLEDWSECPDESLEEQWERLFAVGAADTNIYVSSRDRSASFEIYGQMYGVTPGEGIRAYVGGNVIYISLEAEE